MAPHLPQVSDFGLSRFDSTELATTRLGTVSHMPPELLRVGMVGKFTDVFSFGVLLWEVRGSAQRACGQTPQHAKAFRARSCARQTCCRSAKSRLKNLLLQMYSGMHPFQGLAPAAVIEKVSMANSCLLTLPDHAPSELKVRKCRTLQSLQGQHHPLASCTTLGCFLSSENASCRFCIPAGTLPSLRGL
jgi:serine/threonine protein kinase